ncbi:MAG: ATP-binding protein [Clostridia bacterium]|nr:ATP-binding protein [Clostridia bacterium]
MRGKTGDSKMLSKLFFRLLPIQVLLVAMGAINSIIDGAVAGRFISAETVGVIGLFYPMVQVISAVNSVLLGGTAVLCGRYMGRGEMQKTRGVFSLNLTVSLLIGVLLSVVCFLFPGRAADALGADAQLRQPLMEYMVGFAVGIVPQLLAGQLASFLQMERQDKLGYIGISAMMVINVVLDVLFVAVFRLDVSGLALATALANWAYFLVLVSYYFGKKAQLSYSFACICWRELIDMVRIGLPGALLVFCLAVRSLVINRILLQVAGQDGLSAMSAFNMVSCLFIALCLGAGAVVRMLTSIFMGEEDRDSMKSLIRIAMTQCLALSAAVGVVVVLLSSVMTSIFFTDPTSNVYVLTRQIFVIYGFCVPLVLLCSVPSNYLQAMGHSVFVNIQSVFDGLLGMVIPAVILAPVMGAMGVWLANPIGIVLTILLVPAYAFVFWKRMPRSLDEWMFLRPEFGAVDEDRLELTITGMDDVTQTAMRVQEFCKAHGTAARTAYLAALSLEEMAGNVVRHGFAADKKAHSVSCRVVYTKKGILLRIKDDCIPFNPQEWMDMVKPDDPTKNIGIRMVYRLAQDVSYQNLLGLNVLTVVLSDQGEN